jgi:aryl-alcohol dehydrogenase-like predicted oxidoreductase
MPALEAFMEYISIPVFSKKLSRVALGTWAIGGELWGGTEEKNSVDTMLAAFDKGINVIDTAPSYGSGKAEMFLSKALSISKKRAGVFISTKCGIQIDKGFVRNLTKEFIREDLYNSLKRIGTDYVDIYFVHWPDPLTPIEETAGEMNLLLKEGKIRAIGVSNFSLDQLEQFRKVAPCHFVQPPYNLFERDIEKDMVPYCKKNKIALMTYSALCRGFLSGKMKRNQTFAEGDLRSFLDPKFQSPSYEEYLSATEQLKKLAEEKFHKSLLELAVRWILDQNIEIAIWGARRPDQLAYLEHVFDWHVDKESMQKINEILKNTIKHPQGNIPGPPVRKAA